jgi:hypothetical protein
MSWQARVCWKRRAITAIAVIALAVAGVQPAVADEEIHIAPAADVFVRASRPTRNFSRRRRLPVAAGREEQPSYLPFPIPDLGTRQITEALLRLHVGAARRRRGAVGGAIHLAGNTPWNEHELTFATRPGVAPSALATIGPVARRDVVDVPVTGVVLPSTDVTFALVGIGSQRVWYRSREARRGRPELVLRVANAGDGPATCGDGIVNQASEECDGAADVVCPGLCRLSDCTCPPPVACTLDFYGSYSLRTRYAESQEERVMQLMALGGNFVVAIGKSMRRLDALPPEVLAAPGCSLMAEEDWKDASGDWSATAARARLAPLAEKFDNHPRVWGVCLTHEVVEYTDHDRRVWMYQLAKEFFRNKKVFHYMGGTPSDYGLDGEVESDVLFINLPPYTDTGEYDLANVVARIDAALSVVDRTPGVPLWGQTSINADQPYVSGPETMVGTWGGVGENMLLHTRQLFSRSSPTGRRLSGFFWRSLGRFDWDLAYPPFAAYRARMWQIAEQWRCP